MQKPIRFLAPVALTAALVCGWWVFFPSPQRAIRSRLKDVAHTVSFESKEGNLAKGYNAQKLASYFTLDATMDLAVQGYPAQSVEGRDEILKAAFAVRSVLTGLQADFVDINITLEPDKQSAVANLTGKVTIAGQGSPVFQELNFKFKKVEGKWLIYHVETVKTLSFNPVARCGARHDC
jgi:hypothetical protein